jgi:hypothetical protein
MASRFPNACALGSKRRFEWRERFKRIAVWVERFERIAEWVERFRRSGPSCERGGRRLPGGWRRRNGGGTCRFLPGFEQRELLRKPERSGANLLAERALLAPDGPEPGGAADLEHAG